MRTGGSTAATPMIAGSRRRSGGRVGEHGLCAAVRGPPAQLGRSQVQAAGERALERGTAGARTMRVTQAGEMTLKPGTRPRSLSAIEELATGRVAFSWRARFPLARTTRGAW